MADTYNIIRHYFRDSRKRVIKTGLTLEEAQAHCKSLETSSRTAVKAAGKRRTDRRGPWFDGYEKE